MTDPSQYFRGRTVQEQMTEVIGYVDTRAAEVATDAIASDVAQVHQDMLDADADASAAAASAAAAAGTLANAVKKTGEASQNIEGDITLSTGDLGVAGDAGVQGQLSVLGGCDLRAPVTVPTPSNNTDATTKKYVDDADALKLNITDVNAYAVGMSGNQSGILGLKDFKTPPVSNSVRWVANTNWRKMVTFTAGTTFVMSVFEMLDRSNISYGVFMLRARSNIVNIYKLYGNSTMCDNHLIITAKDGEITLWCDLQRTSFNVLCDGIANTTNNVNYTVVNQDGFAKPVAADYDAYFEVTP